MTNESLPQRTVPTSLNLRETDDNRCFSKRRRLYGGRKVAGSEANDCVWHRTAMEREGSRRATKRARIPTPESEGWWQNARDGCSNRRGTSCLHFEEDHPGASSTIAWQASYFNLLSCQPSGWAIDKDEKNGRFPTTATDQTLRKSVGNTRGGWQQKGVNNNNNNNIYLDECGFNLFSCRVIFVTFLCKVYLYSINQWWMIIIFVLYLIKLEYPTLNICYSSIGGTESKKVRHLNSLSHLFCLCYIWFHCVTFDLLLLHLLCLLQIENH